MVGSFLLENSQDQLHVGLVNQQYALYIGIQDCLVLSKTNILYLLW